jgi:hypothetical protein
LYSYRATISSGFMDPSLLCEIQFLIEKGARLVSGAL